MLRMLKQNYFVPYEYIKQEVDVRPKGNCIVSHLRLQRSGSLCWWMQKDGVGVYAHPIFTKLLTLFVDTIKKLKILKSAKAA